MIYALLIYHTVQLGEKVESYKLSEHYDLSSLSFFVRRTVREHIVFFTRLICSKLSPGIRSTVEFEQNIGVCHAFRHACGLSGAVITDPEYPTRVAFVLLNKSLSAFIGIVPPEKWIDEDQDFSKEFNEGNELMGKFQNPTDADQLTRIQEDLKEIQEIMVSTIDKLLQRGENLDQLMSRTNDLSAASERFYRQARSQNQCCKLF